MKLELTETGWWLKLWWLEVSVTWYETNWNLSASWIVPPKD